MADFTINITEDITPIEYTSHVGLFGVVNCLPDAQVTRNVKVLTTTNDEYGFLETYSGEQWKYLAIQNIDLPSCCMTLEYQGNPITNADLPIVIDIEALSAGNNIPTMEVKVDDYAQLDNLETKFINITFNVTDTEGTVGTSQVSSSQIRTKECPTPDHPTPVIISSLTGSVAPPENPSNLIFEYYIISQFPVTSYGTSGLPLNVSVMNPTTGYIRIDCTTLQQRNLETIIQFDISATHDQATPTTDTETFTLTIPAYLEQYY